jgi:hypothetical protein
MTHSQQQAGGAGKRRRGDARANAGREQRAVALRDKLLPLVQQRGQRHQYGCAGRTGALHLTTWECGPYTFVLREPFAPFGLSTRPIADEAEEEGQRVSADPALLAFGLDAWLRGQAMLSLAWDVNGQTVVLAFQPGAWVNQTMAFR